MSSNGCLHMDVPVLVEPQEYTNNISAQTGCSLKDMLGVMDDCDGWTERVWEIHASSASWSWWN